MEHELLRIRNGFSPAYPAIENLFLQMIEGGLYGLLCSSNGEKQHLLTLLSGRRAFTGGEVLYRGRNLRQLSGIACLPGGLIYMLGPENRLLHSLSLAENLCIKDTGLFRKWLRVRTIHQAAETLLRRFDLPIPIDTPVSRLTALERAQCELLSAYVGRQELILLDNPGRFLSDQEMKALLILIHRLREEGLTFLWLGSGEPQMLDAAERTTVFSNGRCLRSFARGTLEEDSLYRLLTGIRPVRVEPPALRPVAAPVFSCTGLTGHSLRGAGFHIAHGEVLQLVYDDRVAATELQEILRGRAETDGSMYLCGRPYAPRDELDAIRRRVCWVDPTDPAGQLHPSMSLYDNLCLARAGLARGLWSHPSFRRSVGTLVADDLPGDLYQPLGTDCPLHIQQAVLYYKWLIYAPHLLICVNPFASIDLRMQDITHKMLRRFAARGIAVLILSSSEQSLPGCAVRTLLLRYGKISEK